MDEKGHKKGKIYYSMGEVSEMFDVNPSLIRYWESKFDIIKPHKNKKGNRLFTPADVDNLKLIYHLVKEKGMTLQGAQKRIKDNKEGIKRDMEVIERLQAIRAMLMEIREELKAGSSDIVFDDETISEEPAHTASGYVADTVKPEKEKPAGIPSKNGPAPADDGIMFEVDAEVFELAAEAAEEEVSPEIPDDMFAGDEAVNPEETVVANTVQAIFEDEAIAPEYIAELAEELAEEAETAAEVMEAIAAMEQKEEPQKPQVYEQTLF